MKLRVFPDTGVLLSMIVFPRDRQNEVTLAGELLELYELERFDLLIGQAVIDELDEVLDARFPAFRSQAVSLLRHFSGRYVRWPTPTEVAAAMPYSADPYDTPIFASAIIAQPDIVVSNDFRAFHTPIAKRFWEENGIVVESLYGMLCVFGRRRRRDT